MVDNFVIVMKQDLSNNKTRWRILQAAREEFIAKGFRDASLRVIAREVGVTVSNIYNHFDNKDALFRAVLTPLLEASEAILKEHCSEENMELYMNTPSRYRDVTVDEFVKLTKHYRTEIKLLFLRSGGSSLEHYKDSLLERQVAFGLTYLRAFKEKYPQVYSEVSPFFLKLSSTWWVNILTEIVSNDALTEAELEQGLREYVTFATAGWKELMQI